MMDAQRDALIEQLMLHEGLRLRAYSDTVGKLTIGIGRNLEDKGITQAEALDLLDHDIDECVADLATFAWFPMLDAIRQRVMVDFRFNLGPTGLRNFKGLLRALERGDFIDAAKHMQQSRWYQQVRIRGVRLVRMMRTGEDYK